MAIKFDVIASYLNEGVALNTSSIMNEPACINFSYYVIP